MSHNTSYRTLLNFNNLPNADDYKNDKCEKCKNDNKHTRKLIFSDHNYKCPILNCNQKALHPHKICIECYSLRNNRNDKCEKCKNDNKRTRKLIFSDHKYKCPILNCNQKALHLHIICIECYSFKK